MKRRLLLQSASATLLIPAITQAGTSTIVAVRVWPASDYTRVTIESTTPLRAQHFVVAQPPRLGVDIAGFELAPELRELVAKIKPDDPFIQGIRVGQYAPGVVRLVIDLKQTIRPQVFTLPPIAAYQNRLVLDLYPTQVVDPLEALIAQHVQTPAPPSSDNKDPLGELITQQSNKPAPTKPSPPSPAPTKLGTNKTERLIIVALNPGHGGEDPGAIGPGGTREKDIVLQIAHRVRQRLEANANIRAYLTRDADFFVPLHVRVNKARRVQADLFVSIHADAFITPQARGASVFVLSEKGASSASARWLAQKEDAADAVGGINIKAKDTHILSAILDMSTTAQIKDSLKLGSAMLGEIGKVGRPHKAQVEQAGFAVLKAADIPSVLVETAFISNPEEEEKLRDTDYQEKLATAIVEGIQRYFAQNPPLAKRRVV